MTNFENADAAGEKWNKNPLEHRSCLSKVMWFSYASGNLASWENGEITLENSGITDPAYLPGFPLSTDGNLVSVDWINNLIGLIDVVIPEVDHILECLDDDILTLRMGAPAFKMPASPSPSFAAQCLVSSRIMARCWAEVLPPDLVSNERAARWFEQASIMAIMLGGEEAFLLAMEIVNNSRTYAVTHNPRSDLLQFEGDNL